VFYARKAYSIENSLCLANQPNLKSKHNIFDDLQTSDYILKPSESFIPIKWCPKFKKAVNINYLNDLNPSNSTQFSEKSEKINESYITYRRKNPKSKKILNDVDYETDISD
jgi:hypothetical protein